MSITVSVTISDPGERNVIQNNVSAAANNCNVEGDWDIKIREAPDTDNWELRITGPGNFRFQKIITEPGEHNQYYIASLVRDALTSLESSLALLRAQGLTVGPPTMSGEGFAFLLSEREESCNVLASEIQELRRTRQLDFRNILASVRRRDA